MERILLLRDLRESLFLFQHVKKKYFADGFENLWRHNLRGDVMSSTSRLSDAEISITSYVENEFSFQVAEPHSPTVGLDCLCLATCFLDFN